MRLGFGVYDKASTLSGRYLIASLLIISQLESAGVRETLT